MSVADAMPPSIWSVGIPLSLTAPTFSGNDSGSHARCSSSLHGVSVVAFDRLADQKWDGTAGSGPVVGIGGIRGIADWPKGFSLGLVSEPCPQSHHTSPVAHLDVGVLHDISIPGGVLRGPTERCHEQNAISVRNVHHRLGEGTSGDRPGHRDEAHLASLPLVPKAPTAESIHTILRRREELERSWRQHICPVRLVRSVAHRNSVTPRIIRLDWQPRHGLGAANGAVCRRPRQVT